MAISKIILNGVTQMDVTGVTVEASNLLAPNTAVGADGQPVTGTMTEKVLTTKTITANGTYDAEDDNADGYSSVTVNVPSSGGSSWTKVAETSYQVSTTSTSVETVATWATGHGELWNNSKWVYVRIRDTAGKRPGYFYGTDQFFVVYSPTSTAGNISSRFTWRYTSNGTYGATATSLMTGYGVYADFLSPSCEIRIRKRYNSSFSLTIDGTYKVEVYLLDPPTGAPIFE